MIIPEFNHAMRRWDAYQRFYTSILRRNGYDLGWCIGFDTGEAIITRSTFEPAQRKFYDQCGIQIVTTADMACPALFFDPPAANDDEAPIPASWLNHGGQQTLLIDMQFKRAIALSGNSKTPTHWKTTIPTSLRSVADAYCHGTGMMPVGSPIAVSMPMKYPLEVKEKTDDLANACKVWFEMREDADKDAHTLEMRAALNKINQYPAEYRLTRTEAARRKFDSLQTTERLQLMNKGFLPEVKTTYYENLHTA